MQYGLTAATAKRANRKLDTVREEDYRFLWEISYSDICGKKLLLMVNADTRYALVYANIKPSVWKNLTEFFHEAVYACLLREGFTPAEADCYFARAGEELITKTHGRQATGGLNHLLGDLPYMEKIVVDGMYQPYMTDMVNDDLCHVALYPEFDYIEPKKFFVERMREIVDATKVL